MGLTKEGIAAQIIASIQTWKDGYGSENDCEITVTNLIRNYSKPLNGDQCHFSSKSLNGHPRKGIRDHLVPIEIIAAKLMEHPDLSLTMQAINQVVDFLDNHLVIVRISKEEDQCLKSLKLQKSPLDAQDIWSRYKMAGIYDNILRD